MCTFTFSYQNKNLLFVSLMNEKCMKTKEKKPKKVKLYLDVGWKLITQIKKSKPKMKSTSLSAFRLLLTMQLNKDTKSTFSLLQA